MSASRRVRRRKTVEKLVCEALESRKLLAVNVFDLDGTWTRGLSTPGNLSGSLSVDTDTGRVAELNILRTGGIQEGTGVITTVGGRPFLSGGTPLPNTTYDTGSIITQGVDGNNYSIQTAVRGNYLMVATWGIPSGQIEAFTGGSVSFSFTTGEAFASSNPGSGTLSLRPASNESPTLDAISDVNINEDASEQTVNLAGITAGVDETQPLSIVASSSDPALITASSATISPAVSYGQLHQWAVSSGGNGHWYEWLEDTNSWDDAQAAAIARGGYLATPTSNEETHFLNNNLGVSVDTWIGGYQDLSDPAYSEPLGGWAWVTGEPWDYQNWYHADPNDGSGIEHQLVFRQADGMWGDENTATQRRALIEYDSDPRLIVEQSGHFLLSPQLNQFGTATITVTVEDGGLDNDLATPGDNATSDRTFTVNVAPVNDSPTGGVTITGVATEDEVLTADTSTLADEDGLGVLSYQWKRGGIDIDGATSSSYTLVQADVGAVITVEVSYTDGAGTLERVTSSPTSTVTNVNDSPTGGVTINGVAAYGTGSQAQVIGVGAQVTQNRDAGEKEVDLDDVSDIRVGATAYINGISGELVTLVTSVAGNTITIDSPLVDPLPNGEWIKFDISGINPISSNRVVFDIAPTVGAWVGNSLSGNSVQAIEGAGNDIAILSQEVDITPATVTQTLQQDFEGGGSAFVQQGHVTTSETGDVGSYYNFTQLNGDSRSIAFTNAAGAGWGSISAQADIEYSPISYTASDGFVFVFQNADLPLGWPASLIPTLGSDADNNQVVVHLDSYNNGSGQNDQNRSHLSVAWDNTHQNFALPGNWFDGGAKTVELSIAIGSSGLAELDIVVDGSSIVSGYQLPGYTIGLETLFQVGGRTGAEVGRHQVDNIFIESVASTGTTNTQLVLGVGNPQEDEVLSADTTTLVDEDGLGEFAYQWLRDGTPVSGANSSAHTLTQVDVGTQISVRVDYTDNEGTAESLTSAQTSAVVNVNDAPVLDPAASPQLSVINEDAGVPVGQVGTLVSGLIDSGGTHNNFSDVDGDQPGIAIVGVNLQGGTLHYSIDNGATWSDVGAVSEASPRLLLADGTTRLYFEPANEFNGSISDVITIRAWARNAVWTQLGIDIDGESAGSHFGNPVSLSSNGQIVAAGAPKFGDNGSEAGYVRIYQWSDDSWQQMGEDINGDAAGDRLHAVAASSDGMTIAVGAYLNDGNGTDAGHVKVYRWQTETTSWVQRGSDIEGDVAGDNAGYRVSMSSDGNTVAISARTSDGNGTDSGHVRVYQWNTSSDSWLQRGADIHGDEAGDQAAYSLAISGDGNTLTIGSVENSTNGSKSGSVRVFQWNNVASSWNQLGSSFYGSGSMHHLGFSTALSEDGSIFALGAVEHYGTGYARVFQWDGVANSWIQRGVDIAGEANFTGHSVSLSSNGNRLIVGAVASEELGAMTGQLRVFDWNSTDSNWQQSEKFHGEAGGDNFGHQSVISRDGSTIAVGAYQNDGNGSDSGHVRVFRLSPSADSLSLNSDTVSIEVTPLAAPTDITLSNSAVGENSQGAIVGQLTTTDPDVGDTFTYTLVPGSGDTDNSLFYIEGDSFRVGANLDYETSTSANVRIRTTDSHGKYFEKAFVIGVQNYNEPPTDILLSSSSIEENQLAGSVVGTLTSADPDGSGFSGFAESFTYSLASGTGDTDNSSFDVVEDELRTKESFNFEIKDSYSVRLRTEDNMGVPYEKQFVVSVENVNELPTLNAVSPITINENENEQAVNLSGVTAGDIESQSLRVFATSSNRDLIPDPTVTYTSSNSTGSLAFTPVSSQHGVASITVTVEDGGLDNDLLTPEDNETVQQMFQVTVLEVISNTNSAILAKDGSDSLYVSTQYAKVRPVTYQGQQVPQSFFQFAVVGADASTAQNALMFKSLGYEEDKPTHRVLTDDQWRISDLFNSLHNEESTILNFTDRQVSEPLNIVAVAGAYEINGVNNPTLIMQRGKSYVINLNVEDHPFFLQTTGNGFNRSTIYRHFYGNGQTKGEYQLVIRDDAPDELFYQCKFHRLMFGKIIVID